MIDLLTVGLHLRDILQILLRFDQCERMTKALVLDDGGVADALIFVEDAVGKRLPLPANLQTTDPIFASAIWRKGSLDISTLQKPDIPTVLVHIW